MTNERRFQDLEIQARYGQLPDFLGLDEIAFLMGEPIELFVKFLKKSGLKSEIRPATKAYGFEELQFAVAGLLSTEGVTKEKFKQHMQSLKQWPITECLLVNWWEDEESGQSQNTKKSKNQMRNEDFKKWLDQHQPDLDKMKKSDIHDQLTKRNPELWVSGFSGWWKEQDMIKKKPGRKPG